ncbi:hypothetical protein CK203_049186 [Vitis vinifera]|uniref:Uncharacterized protein n=1 Tax=Vitis vinifera TaxID=29760 RepID=A0A438GV33_VITVI|nr:hypothetical protein CK203_049186 [Vitis vinifera]
MVNRGPLGSISMQLDDMLSTPFNPHTINYDPPIGFMIPKFSTYDGTNDPFDHIMHYRQLMTLDIGNDALLCKVLVTSRPTKNDSARSSKTTSQRRQMDGHTTEQCRSLHYLVKKLIRARHLKQYVRSEEKRGEVDRNPTTMTPITSAAPRLVNSIQPRLADKGMCPIDGILVDPGNSVDLLQMSTFKQMGFLPSALENLGWILSGFNGASTTPLGYVMLLVKARSVTLNVQFLVVEGLSPFNTIMGRTWLHGMKVILSTYHQMVSYLIEDGKINLYGSQLAARQFYQVAREFGSTSDNELPTEPAGVSEK